MVVKMQRPLNAGATDILVYNRERTLNFVLDSTPELLALFGDRFKIYCYASIVDGVPVITRLVPDEAW